MQRFFAFSSLCALIAFTLLTTPAQAVDTFWNAGTANWNVGGNWNTGSVPAGGDQAIIENGGHAQIGGNIPTPNNITVGRNAPGTFSHNAGNNSGGTWLDVGRFSNGTFNMNGGNLSFGNDIHLARSGGTATVNQSGGTLQGQWLHTNEDGGGTANYNMTGGVLNLTGNSNFSPGRAPDGPTMIIGDRGNGTFTISGTADVNNNRGINVGMDTGGNGIVNQSGGTVDSVWVDVGRFGGATGQYNISGGTLTLANDIHLGRQGGNGTINQSGGNVSAQWMEFSRDSATGSGVYNLTGGTLTLTDPNPIRDNNAGFGGLNIDGGTLNLTNVNANSTIDFLGIGQFANGSYTLGGNRSFNVNGTLAVGGNATGDLTVNSGSITAAGPIQIGDFATGVGTITQTGGTVTANQWVNIGRDGQGTYNISGGVLNANHDVNVGDQNGPAAIDGELNISGSGIVNVNNNQIFVGKNGGTGEVNQSGGMLTANADPPGNNLNDFTLYVGSNGTSDGTYNLSGGTLNARRAVVGYDANAVGEFNQTGGTANYSDWLVIGRNTGPGGSATYNISGGTLNQGSDILTVGENGEGTFNVSGNADVNANQLLVGRNNGSTGHLNVSGNPTIDTLAGQDIRFGNAGGATGNATISGGTITAGRAFIVGESGTGVVNQSGGDVVANQWLQVGRVAGSTGTYNLSGGTATGLQTVNIGESGMGTMTVSGNGQLISGGQIEVSRNSTAAGSSLTLNGNAVASANSNILVGLNSGANGTLNVNGNATVTTPGGTDIRFGNSGGATGNGNITGGTITAGRAFIVGESGTGLVNQSGGDVTANQWLQVGRNAGSTGTYNLSGGTAQGVQTVNIGESGLGTMTVSGNGQLISGGQLEVSRNSTAAGSSLTIQDIGSASAASNILIGLDGGSHGTIDVQGGTLTTPTNLVVGQTGTGNLMVSGGVVTTGDLTVGQNGGSTGTVTQTGGVINVTNPTTHTVADGGAGTVNHPGGVTNVVGNMNIGTSTGTGIYNLSGTGELDFLDTSGPSLTFFPAAPAIQTTAGLDPSTLTIGANGTFNFNGGTLRNISGNDTLGDGSNPDIVVHSSNPVFTVGDNNVNDSANARLVIGVDGVNISDPLTTRAITTIGADSGTADFVLNSDGTLVIDIFGPSSHGGNGEQGGILTIDPLDADLDSDLLHVTGNAFLDGTLEINLNGYEPAPFHWYDVLLADGGTLDIDDLTLDGVNFVRVIDDPTDPTGVRQLLQVAVPEPASIALWTLLGIFAALRYRRWRKA